MKNITHLFCKYDGVKSKQSSPISLDEIAIMIKSDFDLKKKTENLRSETDSSKKNELKCKLPAVPFNHHGKRDSDVDHVVSGLIQLDFDKNLTSSDKEFLKSLKEHIVLEFKSPSGRDKIILKIEPTRYDDCVRELKAQFSDSLDRSGLNPKQLCFLCYDPDRNYNPQAQAFTPPQEGRSEKTPVANTRKSKEPLANPYTSIPLEDRAQAILKALPSDCVEERNKWCTVGMALKEEGVDFSVFSEWSSASEKYDEESCLKAWESFKGAESPVTFATLVKWATEEQGGTNPLDVLLRTKNEMELKELPEPDDHQPINIAKEHLSGKHPTHYFKERYYLFNKKLSRYVSESKTTFTDTLTESGLSNKIKQGSSPVKFLMKKLREENLVDHVGVVAGRKMGIYESECSGGLKILIPREPRFIHGVEGDFNNIKRFLEGLFSEQVEYLYSWIKCGREQLLTQKYKQGHLLIISGESGTGKSECARNILSKSLGSHFTPDDFVQGSKFTSAMTEHELLLFDDVDLPKDHKGRSKTTANLKRMAVGSETFKSEAKGKDPIEVEPLWRVAIVCNDDDETLKILPTINPNDEKDSMKDKVLLLKAHKNKRFSEDLSSLIKDELPHFLWWIDNKFEIPEYLKNGGSRFGFRAYQDPSLLLELNADADEHTVNSNIDEIFFEDTPDTLDHSDTLGSYKTKGDSYDKCVFKSTKVEFREGDWIGTKELFIKMLIDSGKKLGSGFINDLKRGNQSMKGGKLFNKLMSLDSERYIQFRTVKHGHKILIRKGADLQPHF